MSVDYAEVYRLAKKGRKAEQRGKAIRALLGSLATSAVAALLKGWLFMFAVGVAHSHWLHGLPTIGYWWAVLIVWLMPLPGYAGKRTDAQR
jgi:hypothetical protein